MNKAAQIHRAVTELLNTGNVLFQASVKSVDEDAFTCTVEHDEIELYDVRLNATGDGKKGLVPIPKVNSTVTIGAVGSENSLAVVNFSELSKIFLNADQIVINDGSNNGLIKIDDLVSRLNEIESLISQLKSDFGAWVPVASDGGTALKSKLGLGFLMKTVPNSKKSDFENDKVTH